MRNVLVILVVAPLAAAGCAHPPPPTAQAVAGYKAVRSGVEPRVQTPRHLFCAENGGVEVYATQGDASSDWADRVPDSSIRGSVVQAIRRDPALRDADIDVRLARGEVFLTGTVPSAKAAVRAADDVLAVGGVVAVHTRLASPDVRVAALPLKSRCF